VHVGVIGGGAAGLFAGCFLKQNNADFIVLEKGPHPGRKILLTGGGRCNITNLKSPRDMKFAYREAGNFIYPALSKFPPEKSVDFIQNELGIEPVEEAGNKVYTKSGRASEIAEGLADYCGNIQTNFEVTDIKKSDGKWEVFCGKKSYLFDKIILATGGCSYPATGSAGDTFKIAESLGIKTVPPTPALCAIDFGGVTKDLAGVSVQDCKVAIMRDGKKIREFAGDVLFTHEGLSGPAVMEVSRDFQNGDLLEVDFAPGLTDKKLVEEMNLHPAQKFENLLADFVPHSLARYAAKTDKKCSEVTREERLAATANLKRKVFAHGKTSLEKGYVTRGGIALSEVDRKTMEIKSCPGLYAAGEALDIDAMSGGYNLHAAAATAFLAVDSLIR